MTVTLTEEQKLQLKWERGALKFLLRPHQVPIYNAVWECINDEDAYHTSHDISCGRQLGKSFTETVIAVEFCIRAPKRTVLFVAPLRSQAEEILYGETYNRIFNTEGKECPSLLKPKLDGNIIRFPNGSRIRMGGTDNRRYEDLRGGAAHLLFLDEAGFMQHLDDGVLPALQPMLKTTRGKTIFSSTPPPTLDHPYVAIHRTHVEKGHNSTFTIFDDSAASQYDIDKAMEETGSKRGADGAWIPSTRFRREYLAEFVMEHTIQLAPDWDERFVLEREPTEHDPYYHHYVSMDPGVTHFTALLFATFDHMEQRLHVEDELTFQGSTLNSQVLSEAIRNKHRELWGPSPVYRYVSDNNNKHLIQDLKQLYALPFVGTSKTTLETTRARVEEGMVSKVNTWLRKEMLTIHPRCKMLLGCLRYGVWKDLGNDQRVFAESKTYGHFDHFAALMYLIRNTDIRTNPVPYTHGLSPTEHIVTFPRPESSGLTSLAQGLRGSR